MTIATDYESWQAFKKPYDHHKTFRDFSDVTEELGDGKVQFQETWNVPPSATPLRVRDVRGAVSPLEPPSQTPILESDVVGLVNDLSLRPSKGPGFGAGRAAVINANGGIETAGAVRELVR